MAPNLPSIFLCTLLGMVQSELFHVHNMFQQGSGRQAYVQNAQGQRFMQFLEPEVNETCFEGDDGRTFCDVETTVTSNETDSQVNLVVSIACDAFSSSNTTFREAENCECSAVVTDVQTGREAFCNCAVCSMDDGDSPFAIDCPNDVMIDECASMDCDLGCTKTCSDECADADDECVECPTSPTTSPTMEPGPPAEPLVDIDFDTTSNLTCVPGEGVVVCTQQSRIATQDEAYYSNVTMTVTCDVNSTEGIFDFRMAEADTCNCVVDVTDQDGNERNCRCSMCPDGFGDNPIGFVCADDFAVSDCEWVDCNSQCNGKCFLGCESAGDTCPLCIEPTQPPEANCYDLETFQTSYGQSADAPGYYGLQFDVQAEENIEILGLEISVRLSEINDTNVQVLYKQEGYDGRLQWLSRANLEAMLSPEGDSLIISESDFASVSVAANGTIGFYIRIEGPWLQVNLDSEGDEGKDFTTLPGVGLTSTGRDQYDNSTKPSFVGKLQYRLSDVCTDCPVCPPLEDPNSTMPPDTNSSITQAPTKAPAGSDPTAEVISYSFKALTVRLKGGKELSPESRAAFDAVTARFYRSIFNTAPSSRRRLQAGVQFANFDNEVKSTGEAFDTDGNTITYDQSISFSLAAGDLDEETARALMLHQLTHTETKTAYKEMLKEAHDDFQTVIEVNPVESRSISSDDDGLDLLWIILIAAGGALCCLCALALAWLKSRGDNDKLTDYDDENDVDRDAPEGPIYDHSEKSGDEMFYNESDHKTLPYGQEGDDDVNPAPAPTMNDIHDASESSSYSGGRFG